MSDLIEPPAARRPEEALQFVSQAVSDGDIEAALAQYEGSAVMARWPGRQADGDHDVRGALTDVADLRLPLWLRVVGVLEAPGLALVICERRVAGIGPDGEHVRLDGHGCAALREQPDGAWRIAADAWDLGKGQVDAEFPPEPPEIPLAPAGDAFRGEGTAGSLTTKACLSARNGTR